MARTQAQIALIAETLLTASSDNTRSLQGINATGLMAGNRAYALDVNKTFEYAPDSTLTADNDKVIEAVGGGRWLLVEGGDDPVVVRTLDDLPTPAAGVITLDATVMYLIEGELNLGTDYRIVGQSGSGIQGGAGALIVGNNANALITGPTGAPFRLNNIAVTNNGSGPAVQWEGDGDGSQFWLHDVSLYGTPGILLTGGGDGDTGDYVYVYDSRFYGVAASHAVEVGGSCSAVSFSGCRFLGAGDGIDITCALGALDNMLISGSEFHPLTGKTGIVQDNADAVAEGRLTGNTFWGAGTAIDANVATTEWAASGNVGLADF